MNDVIRLASGLDTASIPDASDEVSRSLSDRASNRLADDARKIEEKHRSNAARNGA